MLKLVGGEFDKKQDINVVLKYLSTNYLLITKQKIVT